MSDYVSNPVQEDCALWDGILWDDWMNIDWSEANQTVDDWYVKKRLTRSKGLCCPTLR